MTSSQGVWEPVSDEAVKAHALESSLRVSVFIWTTCPTPDHKSMQMAYTLLKNQNDIPAGETSLEQLQNVNHHRQLPLVTSQSAIRGINSQTLFDHRSL